MTKTLWVLCALTNSQFQTYYGTTHYQKAVLAVANTLRWAINSLSCLNWLWPILYRQSFAIVTYLWTLRMKDYVLNIALAWTVLNNFVQSKPTPFSPIHSPICLSNWVFLRILCKTLFYTFSRIVTGPFFLNRAYFFQPGTISRMIFPSYFKFKVIFILLVPAMWWNGR